MKALLDAGAAKSAGWSMTNALRVAPAEQRTQVISLHVGYMGTDMTAAVTAPTLDPAAVARTALDGVRAGLHEVLADDPGRQVKAGPAADPAALHLQLAAS